MIAVAQSLPITITGAAVAMFCLGYVCGREREREDQRQRDRRARRAPRSLP